MKVLLVEDDKDLQEVYQLQLEHGGHQVAIAADAQAALDALDKAAAEVIVLDIMLPGHNGLSILYELRSYSDLKRIPVIVLSNVTVEELGLGKRALESLGVVEYLDKSRTKPSQLLEAVATAKK